MEKHIVFALMLIITLNLPSQPDTSPFIGKGTETSPYQISTPEHLNFLSKNPNLWDKHFSQTIDIDLQSASDSEVPDWRVIGSKEQPFTGFYDGQGYSIRNLNISYPNETGIGFFGYIDRAVIVNLNLINVIVSGYANTGGLTGTSVNSIILNSHVTGEISGETSVGGLIGYSINTVVKECYSTGAVTGKNKFIGGLTGKNIASLISDCYSTSAVIGTNKIGGLVGFNDSFSAIERSYSIGKVEGEFDIGGLVGIGDGTVTSSYWDAAASGVEDSDGGTEAMTINMVRDDTMYTNWDFTNTWGLWLITLPTLICNGREPLRFTITHPMGTTRPIPAERFTGSHSPCSGTGMATAGSQGGRYLIHWQ